MNFNQPPTNLTTRTQAFAKGYALETMSLLAHRLILSFGATRNRYALSSTSTNYDQTIGSALAPVVVPRTLLYKNLVQYGLVLKPRPNVALFYGYNENFSANGIQFGQFLPPQQGEQHEVGIKAEWLDGRASASVTHFEVMQRNNSVPAFPQTTPPSSVLVPGTISRVEKGAVSSLIGLTLPGGATVTASVTNDAVTALGLAVGQPATAVFKAYAVMLAVASK